MLRRQTPVRNREPKTQTALYVCSTSLYPRIHCLCYRQAAFPAVPLACAQS